MVFSPRHSEGFGLTDTVQPPPQPPAAAQHALPPVQRDHQRRIQVAEFVIKLSACVGIPWLLFLWQQQAIPNVLTLLVFVTANVLLLLPMRWGHHYVARVIWVCLAACLCLTITLLFGRDESLGHPEVMFFAVLAFPFLLFSWELERRTMIALIVLVASLALLAMVSNFLPHGKSFISATIPQMDPGAAAKSQFLLRVTVSSILLAELSYFAYLTRLSAQEAAAALQTSQSAAQAKGDFLANMSHEIRTPMNGLIGMLEVLEAMGVSARQAPTIGTIRNSAFSLLRIIDDILDTSKIEAGKLDIEMTKVEIIPLIEGVTQTLRPLADSTGVRLRLFIDPQIPEWVISDAGRLRQILLNLISNSVKFSNRRLIDKEGMVIIRVLRPDDDGIRFEILDNGIGMDQALMDRLFQPFSQGEASRALQMSSTGLGLVITKNLIDLLGGSIEVESAVDAGTRMVVDLPMKVANGPGRMPDISGLTIICFDLPDIDIRTGLQMMLQRTAADVHFVTSIQAVLPLKSKLRAAPIILLPTDVAALADELQRTLERLFPQASFIRFSSERTARYGLVNDRTYLLQIFPLMMTDFIKKQAKQN